MGDNGRWGHKDNSTKAFLHGKYFALTVLYLLAAAAASNELLIPRYFEKV